MDTVSSTPPKRASGRTRFHETRHPVYKGVRRRNSDRWVCEVREPKKKSRIWLGTFPTAEMAARAHDVAAIAFHGPSACLNFADSAGRAPVAESSSPSDIQRAAAKVVEVFACDTASAAASSSAPAPASSQVFDEGLFSENGFLVGMQDYKEMAQGMLIDPPPMLMSDTEEDCYDGDVPLWSFSM